MLDWLGDVGGLNDALKLIVGSIIIPISSFAMQTRLLTSFFRLQKSDESTQLSES